MRLGKPDISDNLKKSTLKCTYSSSWEHNKMAATRITCTDEGSLTNCTQDVLKLSTERKSLV